MTADQHFAQLQGILGSGNVLGPEAAAGLRVSGCTPAVAVVLPGSVEEVQAVIRFCAEQRLSVIPSGGGAMLSQGGRPDSYDVALSTRRLTAVTDYQPENLVFASEPGVTGSAVASLLDEHRQLLTLDPPLFAKSTMGGIAAARACGPSRFQYGTPRDLVIGITVVDAAGELVKAGGKVVKSVSGYDLCKLYTGSMGTLGVIAEAVYRLSPLPEQSCALVFGLDEWGQADDITARLLDSVLQPRCIEVLNAPAAVRLAHGAGVPPTVPQRGEAHIQRAVRLQARHACHGNTVVGAESAHAEDLPAGLHDHIRHPVVGLGLETGRNSEASVDRSVSHQPGDATRCHRVQRIEVAHHQDAAIGLLQHCTDVLYVNAIRIQFACVEGWIHSAVRVQPEQMRHGYAIVLGEQAPRKDPPVLLQCQRVHVTVGRSLAEGGVYTSARVQPHKEAVASDE